MVTQKEIAEAVGCSQSLISMVLGGTLGGKTVRVATERNIRETAARMGYRPTRTAPAFLPDKRGTLAVFLFQIGGPGSSLVESLIHGIAAEADRYDQRLWLRSHDDQSDLHALFSNVDANAVDGLIFDGPFQPESTTELLRIRLAGLPVVRLRDDGSEPNLVGIRDVQTDVCRIGAEHLIERGCRRIVHFLHRPSRVAGYLEAVRSHDLPFLFRDVPDYSYYGAERATKALLDEGVEFDGIAAESDHQALAALNVLLRARVRVPEDVKIVGVDDSPFCPFALVPLTSVSKREEEKGRLAVRMIVDMISGKQVHTQRVEPVLRIRESTGL
jgi:LacI family transcriptional regulator